MKKLTTSILQQAETSSTDSTLLTLHSSLLRLKAKTTMKLSHQTAKFQSTLLTTARRTAETNRFTAKDVVFAR